MKLTNVDLLTEYTIDSLSVKDEELEKFLFTLGFYSGEPITVISRKKSGLIVNIKDSRYCIDSGIGEAISVK